MMNQLSLLLRNKVALIAIGAVVVVAVTATVVAAASGAHLLPASASGTPAQCASEDRVSAQTSTQTSDRDETGEQSASRHEVQGTITSIDSSGSSFVITQCNGTSTTVKVSSKTRFGKSAHGLSDLKTGLFVQVGGTLQSNGTFTASSVHVEENTSGDDNDGDHDGTSGTRTPSAHSGD